LRSRWDARQKNQPTTPRITSGTTIEATMIPDVAAASETLKTSTEQGGYARFVRPGLRLDEIALLHGGPPWKIDASRSRPRFSGRIGWRLRVGVYRVGLRRLALIGVAE
jgi:hypothetical protein